MQSKISLCMDVELRNSRNALPEHIVNSESMVGLVKLIEDGIILTHASIFELSSIFLKLQAPTLYGPPILNLGSRPISFSNISAVNDDLSEYSVNLDKPFLNQLGFVGFTLSFERLPELIEVPVEVKSTKATYDDAKNMLMFIQSRDPHITNLCFSQSRLDSGYKEIGRHDAQTKIALGNQILDFLIKRSLEFRRNPCVGRKVNQEVVRYNSRKHHIDNHSIEWLCRHTEQLEVSIDEQDILIGDTPYNLRDIQINKPIDDTDVFENRVIHSFLVSHRNYLTKIGRESASVSYRNFDKFLFTFSDLLHDWNAGNTRPQQLINKGLSNISVVKRFADKFLPCKLDKFYPPKLTANAKKHSHYLDIFKLVHEYYRIGEPDWDDKLVISGLHNLAKIYELYVLVSLVKALEDNNYEFESVSYLEPDSATYNELPEGSANNVYIARNLDSGQYVTLFYEPRVYEPSDRRCKQHTSLYKSINSRSVNKDMVEGRSLVPDFVLSTDKGFIILDAKYSEYSTVRKYYLTELMIKYGYGIMREHAGARILSQGVIAVCAKGETESSSVFFEDSGAESLSLTGIVRLSTRESFEGQALFINAMNFIKD